MIQTAYDNQAGNASIRPSELFWKGVPLLEMTHNPVIGHWDEMQVKNFPNVASASSAAGIGGLYDVFTDTGCTITQRSKRGGEIRASFDGTAEDSCSFQFSGGDGGAYTIETASGAISQVKFEACIAVADVSTAAALTSFILGLGGPSYAANDGLVDATGELGTQGAADDFLGFHVMESVSATNINFTFRKDGQTKVIAVASVGTLVAATYIKLGFHYNPYGDPARAFTMWVNGAMLKGSSYYVASSSLALATFPLARAMAPVYHGKLTGSGGTANTHDIPFMRVAQWY